MIRDRIILMLGGVVLIAIVLGVSLFLSNTAAPEPEPTPEPTVTVEPGPAPTSTPTGGTDAHEDEPDGPDPTHNHGEEAPPADCSGPVGGCEGVEVSRNTQADLDAAALVRDKVAPFVIEWTKINSAETTDARITRLVAAGATPEAAAAISQLARAGTAQTGLTVSTSPRAVQRTLFMAREGGLLKFQASLDVDATYLQPGDSGSRHVAGGAVYVYLTDAGVIARVVDSFPTIEGLR